MEDLENSVAEFKEYNIHILDKYIISYPCNFKVETYSCKDYSGIIFFAEEAKYDVCNNYLLGPRLIINPIAGGFQDIPFKAATFGFLPEGITVKEIG